MVKAGSSVSSGFITPERQVGTAARWPRHSRAWRHFLKEYGIVFLGALTALAAEQSVAWVRTQSDIRQTRSALQAEIRHDAATAAFISAEDSCLLNYDKQTIAWAKGAPRPPSSPTPKYPTLQSTVWETSRDGAIAQMSLRERLDWAQLYNLLGAFNLHETEQRSHALDLASIVLLDKLNGSQAERLVEGLNTLQRIDAYQIRDAAEFGRLSASIGAGTASMPDIMRQDLDAVCHDAGVPVPNI